MLHTVHINYVEEISIKSDDQTSKTIVLYHCKISANYLAMITQFL